MVLDDKITNNTQIMKKYCKKHIATFVIIILLVFIIAPIAVHDKHQFWYWISITFYSVTLFILKFISYNPKKYVFQLLLTCLILIYFAEYILFAFYNQENIYHEFAEISPVTYNPEKAKKLLFCILYIGITSLSYGCHSFWKLRKHWDL